MRVLLALFSLVLLLQPAAAAPSLWHVRGPYGEAWLFGSVHVLPPKVMWRSPPVAAAINRADVFVFETALDDASLNRMKDLVAAHGFLPQGESLRAMLPAEAQPKFDAAVTAAGLPLAAIDHERPWLAGLQILFAQMAQHDYGAADGVDGVVMAEARKAQKPMRYFETIEQQFALLAPDDPRLELEEFDSSLDDLADADAQAQPIVDAWAAGDQAALDKLINDGSDMPAVHKAMFDDRNARWAQQIKAMLREKHHYFITVGAGHLTGAKGVPALLRKAGYRVDGP